MANPEKTKITFLNKVRVPYYVNYYFFRCIIEPLTIKTFETLLILKTSNQAKVDNYLLFHFRPIHFYSAFLV